MWLCSTITLKRDPALAKKKKGLENSVVVFILFNIVF